MNENKDIDFNKSESDKNDLGNKIKGFKRFLKSKKFLALLAVLIIAIAGTSVTAANVYKKNVEKQRIEKVKTNYWNKIGDVKESFNREGRSFDDQKTDLTGLYVSYASYKDDANKDVKVKDDELDNAFVNTTKELESTFYTTWNKIIADNTIADLDSNTDIEAIQSKKDGLQSLSILLKDSDTKPICFNMNEELYDQYVTKVDDMIGKYDSRIKFVQDENNRQAEEERQANAKKQLEEEMAVKAARNEEAKANEQKNNSKSNNNASTSNVTASNKTNTSTVSNNTVTSTEKKGPKPALYTVIPANDFPNDFPKDGWSWRYSKFWWYCSKMIWGGADGKELVGVDWSVSPDSGKVIGACDNAVKYMPPKPTLEESKTMIFYEKDNSRIKFGNTTLYVCLEE